MLRPPPRGPSASLETELSVEQQILAELGAIHVKVSTIEKSGEELRVNLLGSTEEETKHGRLPRLEALVETMKAQLDSQKETIIRWKAYGAVIAAMSSAIGAVISLGVEMVIHIAEKRP